MSQAPTPSESPEINPQPTAIGDAAPAGEDWLGILRRLGPAGVLGIVSVTLPLVGLVTLVSVLGTLAPWLRGHAEVGIAIYVVGFSVLAGIAVLPTHAAAIAGGWAFGFAVGLPAALAGFVGGSLIGYAIARPTAGDRVTRLIEENPKWKAVYDALLRSGFWRALAIVTLLRLPPNSPFAVTNLLLASTGVPLPVYALGTLFGMMPRITVIVWIASHVAQLEFSSAGGWWTTAIGVVITLFVLAVIGSIAQRAIQRVTAQQQ